MQQMTAAESTLLSTAAALTPVTKLELVSRSDPNDIRLVLDTSASDYDPERTGLVRGAVNADVNRGTLRTCDLTLQDWAGDWFPGPSKSLWLDAVLRIRRGCAGTQFWPQGVYEIVDPEVTDRRQVHISGVDKASRANGQDMGGLLEQVTLAKGLNIQTALSTLAGYRTWGETLLNLAATSAVLPYKMEYGLTDYPWQAAAKIAGIPSNYRPLHYDERGYLTWIPDPDPQYLSPVWTIWPEGSRPGTASADEFAVYIGASKQIDAKGLKNWVGVRGGSAKSAPVYAEASDTDAASATAVQNIGYRISWWNGGRPDPLITTVAEAQARANYELRRLRQWQERVPLRITELPVLQPWDVVRVTNPDADLDDTYQIVSYTLPLDTSGVMTLQGWRVRR